ncbi:MAG TPA: SAM-dependent methyltransferase [Planctomycetaceae bacterium]|nr:SAM-dependent methyltransferase [Planctomycetaceae bacterium]
MRSGRRAGSCYPIALTVLAFWALSSVQPATGQEAVNKPDLKQPADRAANLPDGINDSFLDPELDVDKFIGRFEVESREVVACLPDILQAIQLKPGMAVADIGSGTGLYLQSLSRSVGRDGKVFAVDISPKFVSHLKQRVKAEELTNVEVVLCSDRNAALQPNSIDRAFLCDVYHHFEYPQSTLKSIYKALRPEGRLILVDFHKEIEGPRREWMMNHIRAPQKVFKAEILKAGFEFDTHVPINGFKENYLLRFTKGESE